MLKHTPPRHLSFLLIASGLVLLGWGLLNQLNERPSADEVAALARGRQISAGITPARGASPDVFLPAPGAASLPGSARAAQARPIENETPAAGDLAPVPAPTVRKPLAQAAPARPAQPNPQPDSGEEPTRLVIPKINVDTKVVKVGWVQVKQGGKLVSQWEVPDYAAGFLKNSANPGTGGNTVLEGHHNIYGQVFRYTVDLEPGDQVVLYSKDKQFTYQVTDKFIVQEVGAPLEQRRKNAQWIAPTSDERLTLVTCWPYWTNTHRVIVIARPVANDGSPAQSAPPPTS